MPNELTVSSDALKAADNIMTGLPVLVENLGGLGQVMLAGGLILGLVLWLMGRKLARPGVAIGGIVIGALIGAALPHEFGFGQWMVAGIVVGGLLCGIIAWALFRIWMGLACAVMLALVAPAAALIWQGEAPEMSQKSETVAVEAAPDEGSDDDVDKSSDPAAMRRALWQRAQTFYRQQRDEVVAVWEALSPAARTTVTIAGVAGAVGGFLLGLILPYLAASLQSALVGAILIFFCGMSLAHVWAPDLMARIPDYSVRLPLLVIGLIALHGVGIQWTLSRRRADK